MHAGSSARPDRRGGGVRNERNRDEGKEKEKERERWGLGRDAQWRVAKETARETKKEMVLWQR